MASDPCSASALSQLIAGNYLLCQQKPGLIAAGQAEIQQVADNAARNWGPDSATAQVTQQFADVQKSLVPTDTEAITKDNASDCDGADLSLIGLGCVKMWEIWALGAAVLLVILGPYVLPYILPRRS